MSQKGRKAAWKIICWKNWLKSPSSTYPVRDKVYVCRCHALQGSFCLGGLVVFLWCSPSEWQWQVKVYQDPRAEKCNDPGGHRHSIPSYISNRVTPAGFFLWVMILGGSMMHLAPQESDSTKLLKLPKKSYQKCPGIPDWKIGREELQKIDVGRKLTDFEGGDQCILVVRVKPGWSRDHKTPCV